MDVIQSVERNGVVGVKWQKKNLLIKIMKMKAYILSPDVKNPVLKRTYFEPVCTSLQAHIAMNIGL